MRTALVTEAASLENMRRFTSIRIGVDGG